MADDSKVQPNRTNQKERIESIPDEIDRNREKKEQKRKKTIDYLRPFTGLESAAYILKRIDEGRAHEEIVTEFEGDEQLVVMWELFLKHNRWLVKDAYGEWKVSEKGRSQIKRLTKDKNYE